PPRLVAAAAGRSGRDVPARGARLGALPDALRDRDRSPLRGHARAARLRQRAGSSGPLHRPLRCARLGPPGGMALAGRALERRVCRSRGRALRRRGVVGLHEPTLPLFPLLMRRLLVFIGVSLALLVGASTFNWWVDPFAEV